MSILYPNNLDGTRVGIQVDDDGRLITSTPVPAIDSAENKTSDDVIGNKDDTIDGSSIVSYLKLIQARCVTVGTSPGNANTSTRIELNSNASSVDGAYDPSIVEIIAGKGVGQSRHVWEYDGTNKYAYVSRDWKTIPDSTSVYCIFMDPGNMHVNEGLARSGSNNTITLNTLASDQNGIYLGQTIFIAAGTGTDQARMVVGYNGSTKVVTVDADWIVNPDNTSVYAMLPYPGFVHGAPAANSTASILIRDVVGNKADVANKTEGQASIVGLLRQLVFAEEHIHTNERWWGASASPNETNAIDANVNRDFQASSGNNTWGTAIPILGTADDPTPGGQAEFDAHRIIFTDLDDDTSLWRFRIIYGYGTSSDAITAGQWTEIPMITNAVPGSRAGGLASLIKMIILPVGIKMWAQSWNDTDGETLAFQYGVHGYPSPAAPTAP